MDCYLFKKKYRDKNSLKKRYQEAKLFFIFKNYKIKGYQKQQIIALKITMLFPSSKLIILTNKNRLIKKFIKERHYESSIRFMTFSQLDILLHSQNKSIDIVELKKIKINIKEEEVFTIFSELFIGGMKIKINKNNKEIIVPEVCYDGLFRNGRFDFWYEMKNLIEYRKIDTSEINFI